MLTCDLEINKRKGYGLIVKWLYVKLTRSLLYWLLFCKFETTQSSGKRELHFLKNASIRLDYMHSVGAFFWLLIDMGGPRPQWVVSPWEVSPGLYKAASQASHEEKDSKKHSSMVFSSCHLQLPILSSITGGLQIVRLKINASLLELHLLKVKGMSIRLRDPKIKFSAQRRFTCPREKRNRE